MADAVHRASEHAHMILDRIQQVTRLDLGISIVVLMNFAVAQPLLDLLGRNGTFFTAHDMGARDVVVFAAGVTIMLPLVLATAVVGLHLVHRGAARLVHAVVVAGLWLALVLPLIDRVIPGSSLIVLPMAGLVAVVATAGYFAASPFRLFIRFGLVGPPAFLLIFLMASPASGLVLGGGSEGVENVSFERPAPVVVIVLDEFPLASIVNSQGGIDAELFPNLARLAGSSTWFRGATTVSGVTERAVPALLSGDDPGKDKERLPVASEYPVNLFSLLESSYDIVSIEPVSQLCPEDVCRAPAEDPQRISHSTTINDLATVYMHLVLPEALRSRLPAIDDRWAGFAANDAEVEPAANETDELTSDDLHDRLRQAIRNDTITSFENFLDAIEPTASPTAYFGHFMLPHSPWDRLPSGARYEAEREPQPGRGAERGTWGPDEWLVTHGYQRHLLQVGLVDRLIGQLLDRLESSGLYDKTLLVVASDHGISFLPDNRRRLTPATIGGVAHVPLFIKVPGQQAPQWSNEEVLTTDVLPTIVDVLGGHITWKGSGRSLIGDEVERPPDQVSLESLPPALTETIKRKYDLFALHEGWIGLYRFGSFGDLVGTPVTALSARQQEGGLQVDLWHREIYEDVVTDSSFVPAFARGVLVGSGDLPEPRYLAISVNGTIAGIARTYASEEHPANFMTMLWPEALHDGDNDIEVHLIVEEGGVPMLTPVDIQ